MQKRIKHMAWAGSIYRSAHHWWVCTSPWGPPLLLKHLRRLAFSVRLTLFSRYFPRVTRLLLVTRYSVLSAFLLRAFILIAALTLAAIAFAFTSISSVSSLLELLPCLAAFRLIYCFRRWLSAILTCSACSVACMSGNRGSSGSSLHDRMLQTSCDISCVISFGDRVESTQRFTEAICSTNHRKKKDMQWIDPWHRKSRGICTCQQGRYVPTPQGVPYRNFFP